MTEQEKADRLFLSVEEMRQMPEEALTKRAAALVMSKYVFIRKDSLYHVDLTKEEAQKLGVDNKTYDGILAEIAFANKTLEEQRKQGNHIEMPDIRQIYIDSVSVWKKNLKKGIRSFIQTRTVSKPPKQEGLIRTHGNEFGEDSFYPTIDKRSVYFRCATNSAIIPVYTVKTKVYKDWIAHVGLGYFMKPVYAYVPLQASGAGVCATVAFATTDANGGGAMWWGRTVKAN